MKTVRYLSTLKSDPKTTDQLADLFAIASFESAGYEVLHKTTKGASIQPELVGVAASDLAYMKVTFELMEETP